MSPHTSSVGRKMQLHGVRRPFWKGEEAHTIYQRLHWGWLCLGASHRVKRGQCDQGRLRDDGRQRAQWRESDVMASGWCNSWEQRRRGLITKDWSPNQVIFPFQTTLFGFKFFLFRTRQITINSQVRMIPPISHLILVEKRACFRVDSEAMTRNVNLSELTS